MLNIIWKLKDVKDENKVVEIDIEELQTTSIRYQEDFDYIVSGYFDTDEPISILEWFKEHDFCIESNPYRDDNFYSIVSKLKNTIKRMNYSDIVDPKIKYGYFGLVDYKLDGFENGKSIKDKYLYRKIAISLIALNGTHEYAEDGSLTIHFIPTDVTEKHFGVENNINDLKLYLDHVIKDELRMIDSAKVITIPDTEKNILSRRIE